MCEIAIRLKELEIKKKITAKNVQIEEIKLKTQKKVHFWQISLLIATVILGLIDGLTYALKLKTTIFVIAEINSIIFASLTIGLVISTTLVFKRINNPKLNMRPIIKDKCSMYSMTSIFCVSYLIRTIFLISETWLGFVGICD